MTAQPVTKLVRKRNTLFLENGVTVFQKYKSISEAKRESRTYQKRGYVVTVDHSDDPKPQPLGFGHSPGGKRRFYVSKAEEKRIAAYNDRQRREIADKNSSTLGLSKSQMKRVGAMQP